MAKLIYGDGREVGGGTASLDEVNYKLDQIHDLVAGMNSSDGDNTDNLIEVTFIYRDRLTGKEKAINQYYNKGEDAKFPTDVGDVVETEDNPALTFQEWNHTSEELKNIQHDFVVGATYIPTDGKTYIYLDLDDYTGLTTAITTYNLSADRQWYIDWGDGSPIQSTTTNITLVNKTYETYGRKVIKVWLNSEPNNRCWLGFGRNIFNENNSGPRSAQLKHVYIGAGFNEYSTIADRCQRFESITIPNNIKSLGMAQETFYNVPVKYFTLPRSIDTMHLGAEFTFAAPIAEYYSLPISLPLNITIRVTNCYKLKKFVMPYVVDDRVLMLLGNNCVELTRFYFRPDMVFRTNTTGGGGSTTTALNFPSVKKLDLSRAKFNNADDVSILPSNTIDMASLEELVLPEGITQMFNTSIRNCFSLKRIKLPDSVEEITTPIDSACSSLQEVEVGKGIVHLSSRLIGGWNSVEQLRRLRLPDTIETIDNNMLNSDFTRALLLEFPASIQSIGNSNLNGIWLQEVICRSIIPPTLGTQSTNAGVLFYVPDDSVQAYRDATNWSAYGNRIRPLSEYRGNYEN